MTLPQPTEVRLLPRSPYCLSSEGESRLVVASYFVWAPFYEAWRPTSARVLRSLAPVETTHPHRIRATGGSGLYSGLAGGQLGPDSGAATAGVEAPPPRRSAGADSVAASAGVGDI